MEVGSSHKPGTTFGPIKGTASCGCFHKLAALLVGVLVVRAQFGGLTIGPLSHLWLRGGPTVGQLRRAVPAP